MGPVKATGGWSTMRQGRKPATLKKNAQLPVPEEWPHWKYVSEPVTYFLPHLKKIEMAKLILLLSQEGLHDLHDQGNGDTEASCLKPDPLEEVRTFLKEWGS